MKLQLSSQDKKGLINFNDDTLEKFNQLDIQLKEKQEYPYKILDFIDYDNGEILIIKLNET